MSWWDEQDDQRRAAISAVLDAERGREYLRYASGDRGFAAWLLVADAICTRRLAVSIFDIADWAWRDAYDSGEKPGAAVREALQADDTFAVQGGEQ
ncbi:MAG TPA: hypothetical protein VFM55_09270 [Micromonosporaceae bacterium]|nr:hypothetical protein [Micromonosporaceae bacterium]